jgi:hypothetical protein
VKLGKPYLLIDLSTPLDTASVRQWLLKNEIQVLNVAGPRESNCPGIWQLSLDFLRLLLSEPPALHLDP